MNQILKPTGQWLFSRLDSFLLQLLDHMWDMIALKDLQIKSLALVKKITYFHDLIMGWPITKYERRALFNLLIRDHDFLQFWLVLAIFLGLGLTLTFNRRWHDLRWRWLYSPLQKFHVFFQTILYYLNLTFIATPEAFIGYSLALWEDGQPDKAFKVLDKGLTEYPKSAKLRHALAVLKGENI